VERLATESAWTVMTVVRYNLITKRPALRRRWLTVVFIGDETCVITSDVKRGA